MAGLTHTITEHQEVVDASGTHVGTVDHVEGDRIKLTKNDSSDGKHHYIDASLVHAVDTKVHLSKTADEVRQSWTSE